MSTVIRLTPSDWVVILGYFTLVLLIGLYYRRQQKTAGEYFAGGHQVSWWLAGISHYMSGFSAFTFVVYSEIAYRYGLVAILLFWTSVPACWVGGRIFAIRWRRARIITPVEFLEQRCSLAVRQAFAWCAIPAKLLEDGLKIFTTALFLSAGMGIALNISILACGVIVIIYTLLGGLLALVVTDYLQFLMKALAILLLLPLAVWKLGGLHPALQSIPADLLRLHNGPYSWMYLVSYGLIVLISYNGGWSFAQKFYSVPDERSGKRAGYLAAALNFIGTPIMLLPALMARKLMPDFAMQQKPQDVYVHLIFTLLPAGMIGIIVAALFSATMATVSADLNAMAGVLTKDFYQRLLRPQASERTLVSVGRSMTLGIGIIIVVIGLALERSERDSLFHLMTTAFGVLLIPTLLPFLATLLFRSLNAAGVLSGLIAGTLSGIITLTAKTLYLKHLGPAPTTIMDYRLESFSIFINIAVTCIAMALGSRIFPTTQQERQRSDAFFRKLDTPLQQAEIGAPASPASTRILHLSVLAVGGLLAVSGMLAQQQSTRWLDMSLGLSLGVIAVVRLIKDRSSTLAKAQTTYR